MLKFKNTPLVPLMADDQRYPLLPTFVSAPNRPLLPASRKPGAHPEQPDSPDEPRGKGRPQPLDCFPRTRPFGGRTRSENENN